MPFLARKKKKVGNDLNIGRGKKKGGGRNILKILSRIMRRGRGRVGSGLEVGNGCFHPNSAEGGDAILLLSYRESGQFAD